MSQEDNSYVYGDLEHLSIGNYFYELYLKTEFKIVDLGILQYGAELSDTHVALEEITNAIQRKGKFS